MFIRSRIVSLAAVSAACAVALGLGTTSPAAAQSEAALKSYFEGRRVTIRLDMPGSASGVDVHADASRAVDFKRYNNDLKRYGAAIRSGESVPITLVKVKD